MRKLPDDDNHHDNEHQHNHHDDQRRVYLLRLWHRGRAALQLHPCACRVNVHRVHWIPRLQPDRAIRRNLPDLHHANDDDDDNDT